MLYQFKSKVGKVLGNDSWILDRHRRPEYILVYRYITTALILTKFQHILPKLNVTVVVVLHVEQYYRGGTCVFLWAKKLYLIISPACGGRGIVLAIIMSHPHAWGEGGHSIYCGFPSPKCESASVCPVRLCQNLFTWFFLQFFSNSFQILRYGDHRQNLELVSFSWPCLNFQGHREYQNKSDVMPWLLENCGRSCDNTFAGYFLV